MSSVILEIKGPVAVITLNRPEKLNAFNREMALLLQSILEECKNESIRCIYLTGMGKAFSAGQDLAEVTDPDGPGMAKILSEHYNPLITLIRSLEKPVVAAVNGVAAGAGANLALCCDLVVAAASASFIQAFSKIGLVPDSGGTFFLPRLIGFQKASALMMLGEKVNADEAAQMGMIYKVIDDKNFAEASMAIAEYLASMPTQGLSYTKQLLNDTFDSSLSKQLKKEDMYQQKAALTADFKEGVEAFTNRRAPVFTGR
ncbi:MAG: 2-(1,2-epoxy-1,2-dihydrophenyl)acetyl-CoA isomerase [Chitinophagaceae bacterium]|nr:MAG: 2-(1,2-epoxy-1,2-dihydrophenyl)acetyl-CoA isomerase [Chitinophagaceae bacterium]